MSKPTILSIIAFILSLIALIFSAVVVAHGETTIIWNPDGTTTTIIDNGTNATVWGGANGGLQGTINDSGDNIQYWENGGGVTTIPKGTIVLPSTDPNE